MKVIFVGVHNKPDTNPLCIFTKTGKLLQRIIDRLPGVEFIKSNLFDIDHFPNHLDDKRMLTGDWWYRIRPEPEDLIILLGSCVHKDFENRYEMKVLKYGHPSGVWSKEKQIDYVNKMVKEIKQLNPTP